MMKEMILGFMLAVFVQLVRADMEEQPQRPAEFGGGDQFGGGRRDRFNVEQPVFMQCSCLDTAGFQRCRVWRCVDLDVDRRR